MDRQTPSVEEVGWTSEPVWTLWRTEKLFAPAGNRTPAVQRVTRHYAD
jgi:hypothetical protein